MAAFVKCSAVSDRFQEVVRTGKPNTIDPRTNTGIASATIELKGGWGNDCITLVDPATKYRGYNRETEVGWDDTYQAMLARPSSRTPEKWIQEAEQEYLNSLQLLGALLTRNVIQIEPMYCFPPTQATFDVTVTLILKQMGPEMEKYLTIDPRYFIHRYLDPDAIVPQTVTHLASHCAICQNTFASSSTNKPCIQMRLME